MTLITTITGITITIITVLIILLPLLTDPMGLTTITAVIMVAVAIHLQAIILAVPLKRQLQHLLNVLSNY